RRRRAVHRLWRVRGDLSRAGAGAGAAAAVRGRRAVHRVPGLHRGVPGRGGDRGVARVGARSRGVGRAGAPVSVHPIEAESYRILAGRVDLSGLAPGPRAVVARVIHASADLEYAETMVVGEAAVDAGVAALRAGAPIVADVAMVAAGV